MHPTRALAAALRRYPSPLLFAAAGDEVALAATGEVEDLRDLPALLDTMEMSLPTLEIARRADAPVRHAVATAASALALARPRAREEVLRELPRLLHGLPPPDWTGTRRSAVERAMVELIAARPAQARRCARVLAVRGEPGLARWIRIAAAQVDRGARLVDVEAGMAFAARDPEILSPSARVAARWLVRMGARARVPIGGHPEPALAG